MATHDLTQRMVPYLDRHLINPLLQFLSLREIYKAEDLLQAQFDLISETDMVDFATDLYKQLHPDEDVPKDLMTRREDVLAKLETMPERVQRVMDVIENPEVVNALRQDKLQNLQFLKENYNVTPDMIKGLYDFGKFLYNCGKYDGAAELLYHFRVLSTDHELNMSALWGKLASEILTGNWDVALEEVHRLKEAIDSRSFNTLIQQLHHRTWLIHWSLFVFFNHPKGRDSCVDLFFQPQYLNTIQTSCPWILRYLATAVVINRRRKNYMKDLIKIIQQESYEYQDPVTEFVEALFVHFDFEMAQRKLKECEEVLQKDFFLVAAYEEFIENARCFIAETYCRIHQKIDIKELSERLNMNQEDGEKWIVNLIRDTRMDAKIDFEENTVIMNQNLTSVYQQVIERTKGLAFRSQVLVSTIEKREAAAIAAAAAAAQAASLEETAVAE
ncbi:uncharacterized protein VTP21DRAFT_9855 [Calcarisporiella thermophila]|uniref:uncharacterized protein n=1 Tax=Calcarisporiella thermophila TaxID=911321 RepID=UPI003742E977